MKMYFVYKKSVILYEDASQLQ